MNKKISKNTPIKLIKSPARAKEKTIITGYCQAPALARACNISVQGITGATRRGKLIRDESTLLYDLSDPLNVDWIESHGGDISQIKTVDTRSSSEKPPTDRTTSELQKEKLRLQAEKLQLDIDIQRKKYLPTDFILDHLIYFIEKLHTILERSAAVFVQEIGASILEAGEVQPIHINRFTDMVLKAIHDSKKTVQAEVEKYEPKN